jgi:hypothetical protein
MLTASRINEAGHCEWFLLTVAANGAQRLLLFVGLLGGVTLLAAVLEEFAFARA